MGQAAVDLPDPLGQEPLDDTPSADDLLSQMAGEEVDRLLAEAELDMPSSEGVAGGGIPSGQPVYPAQEVKTAEAPPAVVPAEAVGTSEVARALDEADPDTAKQLDALFAELNTSSAATEVTAEIKEGAATAAAKLAENAAARNAAAPVEQVDQQLDDLFAQLTGEGASSPQEPAGAALAADGAPGVPTIAVDLPVEAAAENAPVVAMETAASAEATAPEPLVIPSQDSAPSEASVVETTAEAETESLDELPENEALEAAPISDKPAIDPGEQTSQLEKDVLSAAIATPITGADLVEPITPAVHVDQKLPLWVRLLELFDAPLAAWGDGMREAVGKIAIMTLVNAMALLTYVLIFRRH